jgi:hypothetical protein
MRASSCGLRILVVLIAGVLYSSAAEHVTGAGAANKAAGVALYSCDLLAQLGFAKEL